MSVDPMTSTALLRVAFSNFLSDVVMSIIGLGITGAAVFRWLGGYEVQALHGGLVGVIVAYFYSRNHLTALNQMLKMQTASEVTREIGESATRTKDELTT